MLLCFELEFFLRFIDRKGDDNSNNDDNFVYTTVLLFIVVHIIYIQRFNKNPYL